MATYTCLTCDWNKLAISTVLNSNQATKTTAGMHRMQGTTIKSKRPVLIACSLQNLMS